MEIIGSFVDEDWESLSQIFSSVEENTDFFSSNIQIPLPTFDHAFSTNFCSAEFDEALFLNIHQDQHHDHTAFLDQAILINEGEIRNVETADSCQEMVLKRKSEAPFPQIQEEFSPKKKQRFSKNAQKSRAMQTKKSKKTIQDKANEEGEGSSEDDSNASQVVNVANTKTRGSATDPQSIYARKRRERINERLKILQNLVPNGTKVDISTMLEEAVHYVKFLQLQIKLLSSDDLWMYAPLAYDGMDIGIYQNISPNLKP